MKWENTSIERKTQLVKRICAYMHIQIFQNLYADDAEFNGTCLFAFKDGTEFNDVDAFLFGNLLDDHTPSPVSGIRYWSFEQVVQLGFMKLSKKGRDAFDRLDFSSISAIESQLFKLGY